MVLWEALDALSHQLELCAVTAETRMVVLIDPALSPNQIAGIHAAVTRTGARAINVHMSPAGCVDNDPLDAAIHASDLIITTGEHSAAHLSTDIATLHLHSMQPHMFAPHASLKRRVLLLADLVDTASSLALSDANGTAISLELGGSSVRFDHGFIDADQHTASFPAGWIQIVPAAASVSGQLVLMPGDANLHANRMIHSPVVLHMLNDHIVEIEGENPDADIMRALLEFPGEPSAYGAAGVSIGMNPGSGAPSPFDERLLNTVVSQLLAGVVHMSFGDNLVADRPSQQTITVALPHRTVYIDELPVVRGGVLDGDFAPDVYEL